MQILSVQFSHFFFDVGKSHRSNQICLSTDIKKSLLDLDISSSEKLDIQLYIINNREDLYILLIFIEILTSIIIHILK